MTISILLALEIMLNIPDHLLHAVCKVESNLRPSVINYSDGRGGRNSYGLCQIQLPTARDIDIKATAKKLLNPAYNANIAALILLRHYKKYGAWNKAVLAYNAGSVRYSKSGNYINHAYLRKVQKTWKKLKSQDQESLIAGCSTLTCKRKRKEQIRSIIPFAPRRVVIARGN